MMQQQSAIQTFPKTYNKIDETEYDIKVMEVKRGDETVYQPKVLAANSSSSELYQIYFQTAAVPVLYSTLGVDGDETGDKAKWNKPIDQAAVVLTLKKGCAFQKVLKTMPNLLQDQQTTFDILKKQHNELLTAAFKSDKVKCGGKTQARKKATTLLKKNGNKKPTKEQVDEEALRIYLEDAKDSAISEKTWTENGEEVEGEVIKVKRKVRGVRYVSEEDETGKMVRKRTLVSTFPVFHRGNAIGEFYEKKFGDYIPRNTLLILRVRRSWYTTPMIYGTNLTFDQDVIVLCGPKKRKAAAPKPVVFFEDEDVEEAASGKRKREYGEYDEEEPSAKR